MTRLIGKDFTYRQLLDNLDALEEVKVSIKMKNGLEHSMVINPSGDLDEFYDEYINAIVGLDYWGYQRHTQ